MVAPLTPAATRLLRNPPITLGVPVPLGSSRSARCALTFTSSGWLSLVPMKFWPGAAPLLPARCQSVGEASVRVWPLGVSVTFAPAARMTLSRRALSDFTT